MSRLKAALGALATLCMIYLHAVIPAYRQAPDWGSLVLLMVGTFLTTFFFLCEDK